MCKPNCRFNLVHILTAAATTSEKCPFNICRIYIYFNRIINQRINIILKQKKYAFLHCYQREKFVPAGERRFLLSEIHKQTDHQIAG